MQTTNLKRPFTSAILNAVIQRVSPLGGEAKLETYRFTFSVIVNEKFYHVYNIFKYFYNIYNNF